MNQQKNNIPLISVLIILCTFGIIAVIKSGFVPARLDVVIIVFIIAAAIYALTLAIRKRNDIKQGVPIEDELSTQIKYKAGYYAFLASLYMWLLIFIFKRYFPDVETMLGGGILCSAMLAIIIKSYLKRHYHENED
ncbi:MAG: hypothetical protein GY781_16475 [Gammaproteobacteria bacterium]|nr:hypothetical protein [Gammaproteobacteria bacterium]